MQNSRSLVSGLLILYLLCTVASARAQNAPRSADWTTFRSETGSFTIDVPAKPTTDVQTMNQQYVPMLRAEDRPAIEMNADTMARYRAQLKKYYYDSSRYETYLDQLGIKFPTISKE